MQRFNSKKKYDLKCEESDLQYCFCPRLSIIAPKWNKFKRKISKEFCRDKKFKNVFPMSLSSHRYTVTFSFCMNLQ